MRRLVAAALVVGSVGCAQVPLTPLPGVPAAPAFKEAPAGWVAQAADSVPLPAAWWRSLGDSELDRLEQQLLDHSPDLSSAVARYQQARAATDALRADQAPDIAAGAGVQRQRQSDHRPLRGATAPEYYNSGAIGLSVEYEVDLWGRLRQQVDAGVALEQAAGADLASARLSLQAQLADALCTLRGNDQEVALLHDAVDVYARAVSLIETRHAGGLSSGLDLARARTQLEATRSQLSQLQAQRAVLEHAIAALVGENAATFSVTPAPADTPALATPMPPPMLPATLLQRRPDIAAAQYRVQAAGARVGVARSAYFPSLTLAADGGLQSSELSKLVQMPNLFWVIGPALALELFDGGRRRAQIAGSEAALDEAGQRYRAVVLGAFQQVEDQLALLTRYGQAAQADGRAAQAARQGLELADIRYRQGAVSYLEVVTAQTANLSAQRSALELQTRRRRAAVQLVRALGGGWSAQADSARSAAR